MEEYKKIYKVQYYDLDRDHYIKINRLFDIMTAIATEHSVIHNINSKQLIKKGLSWVVHDINLDFFDEGQLYEKDITVKTFVKNVKGIFMLRYFAFYNEGNLIGKAVQKWLLINLEKRKIVKIPKDFISEFISNAELSENQKSIMDSIGVTKQYYEKNIEDETLAVKNMDIRYGDIDENGHVNNCIYPLWAIESVSRTRLKSHKICSLQITYKKEQTETDKGVKIVCKESNFEDKITEHVEIYSWDEKLLCIVDMSLEAKR